jgi:glycosyltransferase involved in cell wall biosynthesis
MIISICYIQYNRINYLIESLKILENQTYTNIEVVISDDCSTDQTESEILKLKENYKYPIIYSKSEKNLGYDRNYRRSIEIATGEYCFVLGNDDTISDFNGISELIEFIEENNFPDIGFVNYYEYATKHQIVKRASKTAVLGSGLNVAIQNYNCFSFVGGLIYKKSTFEKYNSAIHDGSIYAQMYLGVCMIIGGARLFSFEKPIVGKDIIIEGQISNSYRDVIAKKWGQFRIVDGGLPSVIHVISSAMQVNKIYDKSTYYLVFKKIYFKTFPYWIINYKYNKAFPEAIGLVIGMNPIKNTDFKYLNLTGKIKVFLLYIVTSLSAILIPSKLFFKYENKIYNYFKNQQ